jgi:hypothetical protein
MNLCVLNRPASYDSDLESRARGAIDYFSSSKNSWLLAASEDWFGGNAKNVMSTVGLEFKLDLTGMIAGPLSPPVRPFPPARLRRIDDEETRVALGDLNLEAYGVPREWGRSALGAGLWESPVFGTVAYVGEQPASGAIAIPVDRALYVGWVATGKPFRGFALAELVTSIRSY